MRPAWSCVSKALPFIAVTMKHGVPPVVIVTILPGEWCNGKGTTVMCSENKIDVQVLISS